MGIATHYIESVGADGAGRSEQGEAFHFKQMRGCCHHSMEGCPRRGWKAARLRALAGLGTRSGEPPQTRASAPRGFHHYFSR